ncbi:CAP domain-containing protein [Kribbella endophytica]
MTDSPTPGRHRSRRAARKRSRGLIGPVVSALSVLLAIGPVVYLMSHRDGSDVADGQTKVLNVSEDNAGPAAVDDTSAPGKPGKPLVTVTKTLPNGVTTTIAPTGTPALGSAESTTTSTATNAPSTVVTSAPGGVVTVTVGPSGKPTLDSQTVKPKPSTTKTTTKTPRPPTTTETTPDDPPPPPSGGGGTSSIERDVLDLTNQARRNQGCRPLQLDDSLVEAAGRHASDMVRRHYMDHTNPDGQDPGDRISAAGFHGNGWGENIAAGYSTAQRVFSAWMNSDGHRANILNCKFNRIGIGYDDGQVKSEWGPGSWVQDFGRVSS